MNSNMEENEMDNISKLPYDAVDDRDDDYDEETEFNSDDESVSLIKRRRKTVDYWKNSAIRRRFVDSYNIAKEKIFDKHYNYISGFFRYLDLEEEITDVKFIKYLFKKGYLTFTSFLSHGELESESKLHYGGYNFTLKVDYVNDNDLLRETVRSIYDKYVEESNDKLIKKSGAIMGIGIGIIILVTGLSVGLTRKGNDMVHQSKKWEKLRPSEKKDIIPWTELTDAAGKSLVFTGRYLSVILRTSAIYLTVRKRKTVR